MAASLIGSKITQYTVVAELGRGPYSVVYKAWQQSLGRYVALKVLARHSERTFQKLQAEARLTARLIQQGAPNIRQLYEVGQTGDGQLYVAMEYVENSLQGILQRARDNNRIMNPPGAARLLEPIARALDAIHDLGWIHLDIKPQNILIGKEGRAVLADFGIAQQTGTQTQACTPTYASPEQAAGDRLVGPWSDIYSLGVVLYEMVTGHPPFRGDHDIVLLNQHLTRTPPPLRQANPVLTARQEKAIYKALAKSPTERYRTAYDLIEAVQAPNPAAMPSILPGWARSIPPAVLVGAGLLFLITLLVLAGWVLWPQMPFATSEPKSASATETMVATTVPASPSPPATVTRTAVATRTPTDTPPATATLAPTPTRTLRPTAAPTRTPAPTLAATPSPGP